MQQYLNLMEDIQDNLLHFIENEEDDKSALDSFNKIINQNHILDNKNIMIELLSLISAISNFKCLPRNFVNKFEIIFQTFKDSIQKNFNSYELFHIFKRNKLILYILIKHEILIIDEWLVEEMIDERYEKYKFKQFFFPEIKIFLDNAKINEIEPEIIKIDDFEKKREKCENDSYICQVIRNDSLDKFIKIKNSFDSMKIKDSIFETNRLLMKKSITITKYAAFYGSINIFKYYIVKKIELEPSLLIYAIHSNNSEIIHILEEFFNDDYVKECFAESIKCYNYDLANYFEQKCDVDNSIFLNGIRYHNYLFLPKIEEFRNEIYFYYLCKYNFVKIVEILMNEQDIDIKYEYQVFFNFI